MSEIEAAPTSKHLKTIARRIQHLEQRIEERKRAACGQVMGSATFETSELVALRVALQVMQLYRQEVVAEGETTAQLLRAAAEICALGDPDCSCVGRSPAELAEQLQARALLLEQLDQ